MKITTLVLALSTLCSTQAFANAFDPFVATSSPVMGTTVLPFMSLAGCGETRAPELCAATVTMTNVMTTVALLKEEIKAVEGDAYDFLAGAEKTLALAEIIEAIRANEEGLEKVSDETLVSIMLSSL